jgi:biopolymer transport protein ExbB/TolQ
VAIPSLFAYRFLRGKVDRIVVQMEKEAMKLVEAIESGEGRGTEEVRRRASG